MATRKRKLLRTEADIVASTDKLVSYSDSDADCVPERVPRRVLTRTTFQTRVWALVDRFCTKDLQPSIPFFTGNPAI
jgi:hypothetical protein